MNQQIETIRSYILTNMSILPPIDGQLLDALREIEQQIATLKEALDTKEALRELDRKKLSDLTAAKEQAERELKVALKALEMQSNYYKSNIAHKYFRCFGNFHFECTQKEYWLSKAKEQ